jgi:hypothetical protein
MTSRGGQESVLSSAVTAIAIYLEFEDRHDAASAYEQFGGMGACGGPAPCPSKKKRLMASKGITRTVRTSR